MGLQAVDEVVEQVAALDVLDGVDANGVHAHVQVTVDGVVQVVLDVLALGGEIDGVAGHVLGLQRHLVLPVAAGHEAVEVIPLGVQRHGVEAEEAVGVVAGEGDRRPGQKVDQGLLAGGIARLASKKPGGGERVVVVFAVQTGVAAEVALVGPQIDVALL